MLSNRKPPQQSSPPAVKPKPGLVHQVRAYRLITPLYGGGAKTQEPDEVSVVRASEIRGLLRFWWRATRGGQFDGSLDKMRAAEEAIWGSAAGEGKAGPSPVSLAVRVLNRGRKIPDVPIRTRRGEQRVNVGDPRSPYGYVAFPLRDSRGSVWKGVEFELYITLNAATVRVNSRELDVQEEVEAALWAWETFGGVGARTRRGFGALQLTHIDGQTMSEPTPKEVETRLQKGLQEYVRETRWPKGVPHLDPAMMWVVTDRERDADRAWKYLFGTLKQFRQARYPDRNNRPYGRSKWPEPDAIRRITGTHSPGHEPRHPVKDKFPRGRFGLPIIFQFKENDERAGDPPKTVLEGHEHDRSASRLILRPLACRSGAVGLACVLEGPKDPPGGYVLKQQSNGRELARPSAKLNVNEVQKIEPLNGEPDVLKAFMKILGWEE